MPQRKCAAKRLRVDKKRRLRNIRIKEDLKKSLKKLQSLLAAKNIEEVKKALKEAISKLDKAVSKGLLSKNTASRKKSRLSIKLNKING
ncbi:MAG: 30S ribosomal protein S20 [Candidatus Omnitrophica bacterium]|nr:30S ribosomal protein S20 [Candidatus Omnitrophota bacterium]MDD5351747.1 30S ribosomal protein S20 [Candidatus Omnitrophota bacterium]MDD5550958.1 30S ribosomal protein S20 [Candidatus Omnitrophota bacterium]